MSTFREIALVKIEEGIADLQSRGEVLDSDGILAGAMVDAATIAVQDWLTAMSQDGMAPLNRDLVGEYAFLIREAGKVTS